MLHCCYNCPCIDLTDQASDKHYFNSSSSMSFHFFHLIARFTVHGRRPLYGKKICHLCFQDPATVPPVKLYNRKELVMMETFIAYFHTSLYIPAIQKLIFHFPHVRIMGTSNYGNTHHQNNLQPTPRYQQYFFTIHAINRASAILHTNNLPI